MTLELTTTQIVAGASVLLAGLVMWRASVRRARVAADAARAGARLLSLTGRVVVMAGVIVGVQWIAITNPHVNGWLLLAVLGLPALFAAFCLTRALTVTTMGAPRRKGGGRR